MWEIKKFGFDHNKITHYGNQFLIGHLRLGIRGTLDEYRMEQKVGINLPLIYDQVGNGWRESVNCFNPLFTTIKVNQKKLNILKDIPITHEQTLSLVDAVMSRKTVFKVHDALVSIYSERFTPDLEDRFVIGKYQVTSDKDVDIELLTGIDANIWDINGPHIENIVLKTQDVLYASGTTHEKKDRITCLKQIECDFDHTYYISKVVDQEALYDVRIKAVAHQTYTFYQYAIVGVNQSDQELAQKLHEVQSLGYPYHLENHQTDWKLKWDDSDVKIQGDDKAQTALRYSIYHLLLLAPKRYENSSIPARGISGQTYKGAIFWDTEIFMLPFYLNTDLISAKRIIEYRINTLQGAKDKAISYGFKGAFYAWESQEGGFDACTDYNVTDVFTNRLTRTYFKDKQIHISGDIVYAIDLYIKRTMDIEILKHGALEVILEVARFYLDYGHYAILKDRFEIWDVMGPDEYHERVHNNAFTNQMVSMVFKLVLKYESMFVHNRDNYFHNLVQALHFENELKLIDELVHKVYLKEILPNKLIEQFDGYFKMQDIKKEDLLKKKLHPNEYLGGSGLAGDTQIIKQADVITMLYLFRENYNLSVMKNNWAFYEPRTEHGSSLSSSMYALIACLIDNPEYAYPLFMKSATVDLTGESKEYAGGIYIGGTHPAASGGAYLTAIYGFSGLEINDQIKVNPRLPKSISSIEFNIKHLGKTYHIKVSKNKSEIKERLR